jgi:2-C-methyl-D-erythritol 4-phosphate cytidylyltransferase
VIVVHDGARPLADVDVFAAVVAAVRDGADAAVPGVPLSDTVRARTGEPVDRDQLVAVQTPQAFGAAILRRAHAAGTEATDDASLVESVGGKVVVVDGSPRNIKITHRTDLAVAEALLRDR